jgi:diguanylate cyclase (GGDEF)-like protein
VKSSGLYTGSATVATLVTKPWGRTDLEETLALAYEFYERRVANRALLAPKISVLLVEDSETDALFIQRVLSRIPGSETQTVATLNDAVELLHERSFDVILTDLSLPDARGLDTVFRLRSSGPESAIVVCSSLDDPLLELQLIQLGAQDCVHKWDLTPEQLGRALRFAKERKRFELRLAKMAFYDPLTGLSNRAGWQERAGAALARAKRYEEGIALFMIDLDKFKEVNDSRGHDAGDALLQGVARRLLGALRDYDTIARLGGDEFVVVIADARELDQIEGTAERLLNEIRREFELPGYGKVSIGASIGIAVYPKDGDTLEELLKAADQAMYAAKAAGKGRFALAGSGTAEPVSNVAADSPDSGGTDH